MTKSKIARFAQIETFTNVFHQVQSRQEVPDFPMKGKWQREYFKNDNPIVLELGCGKGEYTVGLAERNPDKNFIGADLKGNRIWVGSKYALANKLNNVAFVRTRIENIETVFAKEEVSEIWITFPDPQPEQRREKKRLTSPRFLNKYKNILKSSGIIHLKTDNKPFCEYSMEIVKKHKLPLIYHSFDLYSETEKNNTSLDDARMIKTYYETMFSEKGFKICYMKFQL